MFRCSLCCYAFVYFVISISWSLVYDIIMSYLPFLCAFGEQLLVLCTNSFVSRVLIITTLFLFSHKGHMMRRKGLEFR